MKKIIGVFLLFLVFCCEKLDDTFCWNCERITFTKNIDIGELIITYDTIVKCDYSEKDAQKFENAHTLKAEPISTCGNKVRWISTICEKQ